MVVVVSSIAIAVVDHIAAADALVVVVVAMHLDHHTLDEMFLVAVDTLVVAVAMTRHSIDSQSYCYCLDRESCSDCYNTT